MAATQAIAQGTCPATLPNEFKIALIRLGTDAVTDKGVKVTRSYGDIGVNGQNIGLFYENPDGMIPEESYVGRLRYVSEHNFVVRVAAPQPGPVIS